MKRIDPLCPAERVFYGGTHQIYKEVHLSWQKLNRKNR